jgi:hypothetical protein
MQPLPRKVVIGVLLLGFSLAAIVIAQDANWMTGTFEVVTHKNVRSVGGTKQTVYSGLIPRTYRFTSQDNPSGLWAVSDGTPTPIPTSPSKIEVSGSNVTIELRTQNQDLVRTGSWIDVPQHNNLACGATGVTTVKLKGSGSTEPVYKGSINRVFRFTSQAYPTGLWVRTDAGAELPIPTFPTAIDIGGNSLTVVVKTDEERTACWQDVTQ